MKKWLVLSIISFLISSMTIWLMPYVSFEGEEWQRTLGYVLGGVFWGGFFMGLLFQLPISRRRKADKKYTEKRRFAFSNKPAIFFVVMLITSGVVAGIAFFTPAMPQLLSFGAVFGLVFSLKMHGLFNGRNYIYLLYHQYNHINQKPKNTL